MNKFGTRLRSLQHLKKRDFECAYHLCSDLILYKGAAFLKFHRQSFAIHLKSRCLHRHEARWAKQYSGFDVISQGLVVV